VRRTALDKDVAKLLPGADATDEVSKLVQQAATSYKQAIECLDDHTAAKAAASDLMGKIARFGKRWQDIDAQMPQGSRTELEARTTDLTARIEKATDDSVRSEYDRARSAVKEQLAYLDEIDKGRQRAIARLHHQVATLDRLRLAALRHRSVGASKLGEELRTLVEELGQAGQELDTAAELAELPG
jgi:prefoldin subunit 5